MFPIHTDARAYRRPMRSQFLTRVRTADLTQMFDPAIGRSNWSTIIIFLFFRAPPKLLFGEGLFQTPESAPRASLFCGDTPQRPGCRWFPHSLCAARYACGAPLHARGVLVAAKRRHLSSALCRRVGETSRAAARPFARLAVLEHAIVAGSVGLSIKADRRRGFAHSQVVESDLRQPFRQMGIDEQHVQKRVGIVRWKRMLRISRVSR